MVKIYSRKTCAPCNSLKNFLDYKKVKFEVIDLDEHPEEQEIAFKMSGQRIVPITVINDQVVSGLNLAKIASLLCN